MGGLCCCCPRSDDFEEYSSHSNGRSSFQHCICFRCCWTWFFPRHSVLLEQGEGHDSPSTAPGGFSSISALLVTPSPDVSSPPDVYHAPPTPLPFDADQSFPRQTRDGCVKIGNSRSASGVEPLPRANEGCESTLSNVDSCIDHDNHEGIKSEICRKTLPAKAGGKGESKVAPIDDEDACPTCLDGRLRMMLKWYHISQKMRPMCCHLFSKSFPGGCDCCLYSEPDGTKRLRLLPMNFGSRSFEKELG